MHTGRMKERTSRPMSSSRRFVMKRFLHIVLTALVLASSCMKEKEEERSEAEGRMVDVTLHFGSSGELAIEPTKTSLGIEQESTVYNLYVFIFDSSGKKIYGKFFDHTNRSNSTLSDWWEVTNNQKETAESVPLTSGTIHMHAASKSNCIIVAISNIDAEMVNVVSWKEFGVQATYITALCKTNTERYFLLFCLVS